MRKRLIAMLLASLLAVLSIPQITFARADIAGNGKYGISIDINASPYTDRAQIPTWGAYAYGPDGCAWFASSRVTQLTGRCNTIYSGSSWYNTQYASHGFSRGREFRNEKMLACYQGHVTVVENVNGDTVTVSEGGMSAYPNNGCCVIHTIPKSELESSRNGAFLGYVYLGVPFSDTPPEPRGSRMETGGPRVISDGDYHIVSALEGDRFNPGQKCLTISGLPNSKDTDGANAELGSVLGLKDHVFTVTWLDNGFYKIKLKESDNKCLDVESGDTLLGKNVQQWEDNGTDAQQWCIKETANGLGYTIQARCSGYYLDVYNADTNNGTNIHVWEGNDTNAQRWYFVPWGGGSAASQELQEGEYHIVPKMAPDKALNAMGNGVTDETNVQLWACREDGRHTFQVKWLGNGYYELINTNSGLALDVSNGLSKIGTNVQLYKRLDENNKKWLIKPYEDGSFGIISKCNGLYLTLLWSKTENGTNIHVWNGAGQGTNAANDQRWYFVPWGPSVGKTIKNGEYQIVSMMDESKTLSVAEDGEEAGNGTNLELNSHKGDKKHTFDIHYLGNGYYSIVNTQTDLALDAANGGMTNGSNAQLWELNSTSDMQKWIIKPCGDGSFFIISGKNNLYLDAASNNPVDGTNVHMWQGHGGINQKWRIVPYTTTVAYETILKKTKNYLFAQIPGVGSAGGEWLVLGLARYGAELNEQYRKEYLKQLEKFIAENFNSAGQLAADQSTENSRVILALTALGYSPANVNGKNILQALADFDFVTKQGVGGPIWALLALDSKQYEIPELKGEGTQTMREELLNYILEAQLSDGGWNLSGEDADTDVTAMAIQALAPYYAKDEAVKAAVDKALVCLSNMQGENGGYESQGVENAESCAQVLAALASLGIDGNTDGRFVKKGSSVLDALLTYAMPDGGFRHTPEERESDQMATEQSFYALAAYQRFQKEKNSLWDMTDVEKAMLKGDANGNLVISADDALAVLKQIVGIQPKGFEETAADCDGKEGITAADALQILKFVLGIIQRF